MAARFRRQDDKRWWRRARSPRARARRRAVLRRLDAFFRRAARRSAKLFATSFCIEGVLLRRSRALGAPGRAGGGGGGADLAVKIGRFDGARLGTNFLQHKEKQPELLKMVTDAGASLDSTALTPEREPSLRSRPSSELESRRVRFPRPRSRFSLRRSRPQRIPPPRRGRSSLAFFSAPPPSASPSPARAPAPAAGRTAPREKHLRRLTGRSGTRPCAGRGRGRGAFAEPPARSFWRCLRPLASDSRSATRDAAK